ncbi:hypothetical protein CDAR_461791 [Caerostris darwini]|uniref:Uncharacterized protein n=1 Tax=Caerostris darwini TaxID=1538125 RepID=A0AAV4T9N0_9ARAC|nr:hypothetical protein CDAR_461791 [Caerostris darwini]
MMKLQFLSQRSYQKDYHKWSDSFNPKHLRNNIKSSIFTTSVGVNNIFRLVQTDTFQRDENGQPSFPSRDTETPIRAASHFTAGQLPTRHSF